MNREYSNIRANSEYNNLINDYSLIPISFVYDDVKYLGFSSDDFLLLDNNHIYEADNIEKTVLEFLLKNEINVYVEISFFYSHGFTSFTVSFENKTDANSKIIQNVEFVKKFKGDTPILKGILGDHNNLYRPYEYNLSNENVSFCSESGRATHIYFPYFNLEYGNGGAMLAIGWAGTWSAQFEAVDDETLYRARSVNGMRTFLKPGEKIRTAVFTVGEYTVREESYATNYWRDWYVKYILPKTDKYGNNLEPFSTCVLANDTGLPQSDGSISETYFTWKPSMEKMLSENIKPDFRWVDAGWYVAPDGRSALPFFENRDWGATVGTWQLDPNKWPENTFLESMDYARANGMKNILWFEPEVVSDPQNLKNNYGYNPDWALPTEWGNVYLNNIGNEDCLKWTLDRMCTTLKDNKVEMYREDENADCSMSWNYMDSKEGKDRTGITECKYIDAHYKMWDSIIECTKSYDGCAFVDSCASGGGRNDLESMRRGVPILRSDNDRTSTALRLSITTSFNKWIPFCGAITREKEEQLSLLGKSDVYVWRASYLPSLNIDARFVHEPDMDYDLLRFGINEWKKVKPYLLKEFYTLTPWHSEEEKDSFTAYTYFDPETECGVLFVFRQEECETDKIEIELPFDTSAMLTDVDTQKQFVAENGIFTAYLDKKRTAKLYFYKLK